MINTEQYSLIEHRRNETLSEELKLGPVENKLAQYKQKMLNHTSRMEEIRYEKKKVLDY
jgi:hypothetical protein